MFGFFKKIDPAKLLKDATSAKKKGDLEEAISLLKKSYKAIAKSDMNYGVKSFLRLPLYLQEAKKTEEAWNEFKVLLKKGYPNQAPKNYPELVPMDHSIIYDKMRLFLQREGRNHDAVKFGLFSHLSWASGLYMQNRNDEFKDFITAESIDNITMTLLKKAKKANKSEKVSNLIKHEIKNIPKIDLNALGKKIDNVIVE